MKTIKITTPYEVIRIEDCNERDVTLFKEQVDEFMQSDEEVWELQKGSFELLLTKHIVKRSLINIY
ncbi:hypothetical protein AVT42_gp07 [Polaribacter phage P12002S]|uniref:Uncharacterized protein n=1 Tax=Polaribacter phage P12002S TaxID=1647387 RepID=A0A0F7IJY4_9CAUD|nr:hypothetical protein AVT42_gp07 [Polaribacter phage P12002S]AKG94263.1 hypothetical protein P12002S_0007 [Polaribacter phage P12002S]